MPPKKRKKHLANVSSLAVSSKQKIESKNVDPRTVLFVDLTNLESLINIFKCPDCQQSGSLKRRQSQKQFTNLGSYASQAQRDIDNARQSFIVRKKENDDDLPEFNELDRPPDELEEEEIEPEVED
jgi:hypothetical protein